VYDTGLLSVLLPEFEKQTGVTVKTLAVGSGEALAMGQRGEVDVIISHSPNAEEKFIAEGYGESRRRVMHNYFTLAGPLEDPAQIKNQSASAAFAAIAKQGAIFVSRGDRSGTHLMELNLWQQSGVGEPVADWYLKAGQGMGQTLQIADQKRAYVLTDHATFLSMKKKLQLVELISNDEALRNVYSVIVVSHKASARLNQTDAQKFATFLLAPETQQRLAKFGVDSFGEPFFFPEGISQNN
jgi:tungstate transport system substrate-binding protein